MVLTREILAVHLPKTGGTWLRYVLRDLCGGRHVSGTHTPLSLADRAHLDGRTVVGTVRDPRAWYVSLYTYAMSGDAWSASVAAYGRGESHWRAWLRGVTRPRDADRPPAVGVIWHPREADPWAALLASGLGLCSWAHRHAYGRRGLDVALRTAHLAADLLSRLGIDARGRRPENARRDLRPGATQLGPVDWRAWYDDELESWVTRADGSLQRWVAAGALT